MDRCQSLTECDKFGAIALLRPKASSYIKLSMPFPRSSGILLHPTSFPSRFGIGDLGLEALRFIDFLLKI